ncbi:DUF3037 domain-containing protein [Amycolatopsis anabasis]|uniref:DUF3037 domain-containing protein n=1 Tax=Amycolatopsis anabasis TaxID=1840409 RepID=UPI00131BDE64|nr:DUF3037 domain-containing protein [Amycolatopsis anabasis]
MTDRPQLYEYALLRVVPRVDRGESLNAGVVLHCRALRFLGARVHLDADRLRALDPAADVPAIEHLLHTIAAVCDGEPDAGPAVALDPGKRFRWLTAPRSTVVQTGPVHTGRTADPAAEADRLLRALVLPPV